MPWCCWCRHRSDRAGVGPPCGIGQRNTRSKGGLVMRFFKRTAILLFSQIRAAGSLLARIDGSAGCILVTASVLSAPPQFSPVLPGVAACLSAATSAPIQASAPSGGTSPAGWKRRTKNRSASRSLFSAPQPNTTRPIRAALRRSSSSSPMRRYPILPSASCCTTREARARALAWPMPKKAIRT